jgi:uncharacterized protein (DUF427 family)
VSNLTIAGTKDHPITIGPIAERVRIVWRGRTIGETTRALELIEAGYKPVAYISREDVDMSVLERSDRVTTCPYKGEANYFTIRDAEHRDDNAVWTYERPKSEVVEIASRLAFYPSRVELVRGD